MPSFNGGGRGVVALPIGIPWTPNVVAPCIVNTTPPRYRIIGIVRDINLNPVSGVTVDLYETVTHLFRGSVISNAGGNYAFEVTGGLAFRVDAYLPGSPDVFGTTLNTLVGS